MCGMQKNRRTSPENLQMHQRRHSGNPKCNKIYDWSSMQHGSRQSLLTCVWYWDKSVGDGAVDQLCDLVRINLKCSHKFYTQTSSQILMNTVQWKWLKVWSDSKTCSYLQYYCSTVKLLTNAPGICLYKCLKPPGVYWRPGIYYTTSLTTPI